jgi:arsenate reductase-like glutaredoxin family protein|uniref:Uncharacterized protein n=1 Tax=Desulfobacca acetoxidans TaxID=60893 RepID=A0A7C5EQF1_9BACT
MTQSHDQPQSPPGREPELLKSMTLGIVGDLGRLFKEQGLGLRPIRILEALIFAMFVVTEAFVNAKKGLEPAREALDQFHEDMVEHIFREYVFKETKAKDLEEVESRYQELNHLINERYQEYRRLFLEDYQIRVEGFAQTLAGLYQHLFTEPLPEGEGRQSLINLFSMKMVQFWTGCTSYFQPQPA